MPAFLFHPKSENTPNMPTPAQVSANQANAQHSCGPKTEAGKTNSSMNNFRHGLAGLFSFAPDEDPVQFETLAEGLRQEHQPATITEQMLVEKLAQHFWLQQRAHRFSEIAKDDKQFALFLRYQTTHDRAFHKCLDQLLKLRAEKRKAEIGFESQKQKQAEEARRQQMHEARVRLTNAKAGHLEFEADVSQTIDAPLPGDMRIPFDALRDTFKLAVHEVSRQLRTEKAA
jgi:low affinity Fe/Cu permease